MHHLLFDPLIVGGKGKRLELLQNDERNEGYCEKRMHLQVQSKHRPPGQYRPQTRGCPTQPSSCIRDCIIIVHYPVKVILVISTDIQMTIQRSPASEVVLSYIYMVHQLTVTKTHMTHELLCSGETLCSLMRIQFLSFLSPGQTN